MNKSNSSMRGAAAKKIKSFLLLFFKKEGLASSPETSLSRRVGLKPRLYKLTSRTRLRTRSSGRSTRRAIANDSRHDITILARKYQTLRPAMVS